MKPIGRLREDISRHKYPEVTSTVLYDTPLKKIDEVFYEQHLSLVEGEFFWNNPSRASVEAAEMRLDEDRPVPSMDESKLLSLVYCDRALEVPLTAKMWTHEETIAHMELLKGTGFPISMMGYKTREEFINSGEFQAALARSFPEFVDWIITFDPFVRNVGKHEYATMRDYRANKSRTFNVHNAPNLYGQLRCFGEGNERLKNHMWSAYGTDPFHGGVNAIAQAFLEMDENKRRKFPLLINWDARGYDRLVEMDHVIKRRLKFFKLANLDRDAHRFAEFIAEGLVVTFMVMTNGDVVIRWRGNNSGSGCTTANNIEAGFEIVTDILIAAYYKKYGEFPEYQLIYQQVVKLYGDDNGCALMIEFEVCSDETWLRDRLYRYHAIELKELHFSYYQTLEGVTFLGFEFQEMPYGYAPLWDISRLLLALYYDRTTNQYADLFVQRAFAVLLMSFASPLWYRIRDLYIKILFYYSNEKILGSGHPTVKSYIRLGVPTVQEMNQFYFGLEADGPKIKEMRALVRKHETKDSEEYLAVYPPYFVTTQGGEQCVIRMIGYDNLPVVTTAETQLEAFDAALVEISNKMMDYWQPPSVNETRGKILQQIIPGLKEDYGDLASRILHTFQQQGVGYLKHSIVEEKVVSQTAKGTNKQRTSKEMKEGSFNKYGNGQTDGDATDDCDPNYDRLISEAMDCDNCDGKCNFLENQIYNQYTEARWRALFNPGQIQQVVGPTGVRYFYSPPVDPISKLKVLERTEAKQVRPGSYNPYGNENLDFVPIDDLQNNFGQAVVMKWRSSCYHTPSVQKKMFLPTRKSIEYDAPGAVLEKVREFNLHYFGDFGEPRLKLTEGLEWNLQIIADFVRIVLKGNRQWRLKGKKFLEGSFNKYGNGQKITKGKFIKRFLEKNPGSSRAQAEAAWERGPPSKRAQVKTAKPKKKVAKPNTKQALEVAYERKATPAKNLNTGMVGGISMGKKEKAMFSQMSACAANYAHTLAVPFHFMDGEAGKTIGLRKAYEGSNQLPCIPTIPAIASQKVYLVGRTVVTSSATTGGLAVMYAPWRLANNYSTTVNTDSPLLVSLTGWAGDGTTFPAVDSFAAVAPDAGTVMLNIPSQYVQTDLAYTGALSVRGRGVKYRLVAAGLRILYTGAVAVRQGTYHIYQSSDHSSLSSVAVTAISNIPSYFTEEVDDEWHTMSYAPVDGGELDYGLDGIVNFAALNVNSSQITQPSQLCHYMGILVSGGAVSTQYQVQTVAALEVIGEPVPNKTKSDADEVGLSKTLNVLSPNTGRVLEKNPSLIEAMVKSAPQTTNELLSNVKSMGMPNEIIKAAKSLVPEPVQGLLEGALAFL